jgi:hypothetical protein
MDNIPKHIEYKEMHKFFSKHNVQLLSATKASSKGSLRDDDCHMATPTISSCK